MRKEWRRITSILLLVIMVMMMTAACNDKETESRIKTRLINKTWYLCSVYRSPVSNNTSETLESTYVFSEDGTFTNVTTDSFTVAFYGPSVSNGTYSIDTKDNVIKWKRDNESEEHEFYYSFENGSFRLYNGTGKEFQNIGDAY